MRPYLSAKSSKVALPHFKTSLLCRLSRKIEGLMDTLNDKQVYLVSTVPLPILKSRIVRHLMLHMSWTDEMHESCLYASRPWRNSRKVYWVQPQTYQQSQGDPGLHTALPDVYCVPDRGRWLPHRQAWYCTSSTMHSVLRFKISLMSVSCVCLDVRRWQYLTWRHTSEYPAWHSLKSMTRRQEVLTVYKLVIVLYSKSSKH